MKKTVNILLATMMLAIIMIGTSGMALTRCSCSGKTSVALPMQNKCCPAERGCMTVEVLQVDDSYSPSEMPQIDVPVGICNVAMPREVGMSEERLLHHRQQKGEPPWINRGISRVMRV